MSEGPCASDTAQSAPKTKDLLQGFFAPAQPGDDIALQAYLTETPAAEQMLQALRLRLRNTLHLATTLGYSPRVLPSTGQFH